MSSDNEGTPSWALPVLAKFELAGIDAKKVEGWLTKQFVHLRHHEEDLYALSIYLNMKMASLPDSFADEEDLLTQHFCFTSASARRIIDAVKKMGDHTTLLDEVSVLLDNARFLQANRCTSAPFTWTYVGEVTPDVHPRTRNDLCVFNVPRTVAGHEDELQTALADLRAKAENEGYFLMYHGTTWSNAVNIIEGLELRSTRPTDFMPRKGPGAFYLGDDWFAAREWAENRASQCPNEDPAVVIFRTDPKSELIARQDNLSLDLYPEPEQEDEWDRMVNGCRLDRRFYAEKWRLATCNKSSITGSLGKRRGAAHHPYYERDKNSWQMAVFSIDRLEELMPQIYGVVVWGQEPPPNPVLLNFAGSQHSVNYASPTEVSLAPAKSSLPQTIMSSDDEGTPSWYQIILSQFELVGIDALKVEEWLTKRFARLRYHEEDLYAMSLYLRVKAASLPDSVDEDLLTNHFGFKPESVQRIVNAVQRMGTHTTLLDEVSVLLDNARFLQANRCTSAPFTWTYISEVTPEVHPQTRDDLCVFNVPRTIAGFEDRLQTALEELWGEAENEGYFLMYHGTMWSNALNIIRCLKLSSIRRTDFMPLEGPGAFYLGDDWFAAREWAENRASQYSNEDPAVVIFRTEPKKDLIAREDNLSLGLNVESGQEDDWDRMVNGCRLDRPKCYFEQWRLATRNKSSITGPIGKRSGTAQHPYYERDQNSWQMAVFSIDRLAELMPHIYGVVVWTRA